jgi:hypothetical protein
MGLKGYRLWAMGQLDSTCSAPPSAGFAANHRALQQLRGDLVVALQVMGLKGKL